MTAEVRKNSMFETESPKHPLDDRDSVGPRPLEEKEGIHAGRAGLRVLDCLDKAQSVGLSSLPQSVRTSQAR